MPGPDVEPDCPGVLPAYEGKKTAGPRGIRPKNERMTGIEPA